MSDSQRKDHEGLGGLIDTLREAVGASNPGLITREDMSRLEDRIEAIEQLVDELEDHMAAQKRT